MRRALPLLPGLCLAGLLVLAAPAAAQIVERSTPTAIEPEPSRILVEEADISETDDRPLGVDLTGIRLIGATDPVEASPAGGLGLDAARGVAAEDLAAQLGPFLDRPLSRLLIARIRAAIARAYREAGRPFVSVTVPPQEVTGGVLQLRIVEFRLGAASVADATHSRPDYVLSRIRAAHGEPIDAAELEEDLDWLNRNPYRRVYGEFSPGDADALSDLTLRVDERRPWSLATGWNNDGSSATGRDRIYVEAGAWAPALADATIIYRLTGSTDLWGDPRRVFLQGPRRAKYLSHAARLVVPTLPRQEIEIAPAFVATYQKTAGTPFSFENEVFELPILYRAALSSLVPATGLGTIYGGLEVKQLKRRTFFNGTAAGAGRASLLQFVAGWSRTRSDSLGTTAVDLRVKANPGGILADNGSAAWSLYSGGRVTSARYAYLAADVSRATRLPHGFALINSLSGVLAGQPLPDPERMALGGAGAVRGYPLDEAGADTGLVIRNELRLPDISPFGDTPAGRDRLSAYGFVDFAFGRDLSAGTSTTLASAGAGFDYEIGRNVSAGLFAGVALGDGAVTRAGDWSVGARLRIAAP